jgi:endonuclease-3
MTRAARLPESPIGSAPRAVNWKREMSAISGHLVSRFPDRPLPSVSEVARVNGEPFRVLVATMISLRTKDEVTARASGKLLAAAPTPRVLAGMPESRISRLIYPAGFYRVKAKSLRKAARIIVDTYRGTVPSRMEDLLALPGVGRKTANLVRNLGFGLPGICVDTHVHRVSNRLGWVATKNPGQTEMALMERLPRRYWISVNELLVRFGQAVCVPISPWCSECPVRGWCPRAGVKGSR